MTRRRLWWYAITGLVVYAAVLAATVPAPWVSHLVEMATERKVLLREPRGTAWAGSGRLYARERAGALVDLGAVRWSASAAALLAGRLDAELSLGEAAKPMHVQASPRSVTFRGLEVEFPGNLLAAFSPELATLGAEGTVRVRSDSLRIDADSVLGLAEIEWRGMRLARAQNLELGSHVVRLRGGGAKVDIELATLEGPLRLSGGGSWTRKSGVVVSGAAEARAPSLVPFLKSVCAEYRDSRCSFRYSGF